MPATCEPDRAGLRRFLTVNEAAVFSSPGRSTIRRLLDEGRLTKYRPLQGRVLVDVRELEEMVLASAG